MVITLKDDGFTLVEMLAVLAVLGVVFTGIYSFYFSGVAGWQRGVNQMDCQQSARIALEKMARELRYACGVEIVSPEEIHFSRKGDNRVYLFHLAGEELVFESKVGGVTYSHNKVALDISSLEFSREENQVINITISASRDNQQKKIVTGVRPRNEP